MSIKILAGTKETLDAMKGHEFVPHNGEGVVYIKLAFVKPNTIQHGNPAEVVENASSVVLVGQLSEIRAQLNTWFDESEAVYKGEPKTPPEPPKERW